MYEIRFPIATFAFVEILVWDCKTAQKTLTFQYRVSFPKRPQQTLIKYPFIVCENNEGALKDIQYYDVLTS